MSEALGIQLITTVGLIVVAIIGKLKLDAIGRDARASRVQTENEHEDTEYPNLRDEVTAIRTAVSGLAGTVEAASESAEKAGQAATKAARAAARAGEHASDVDVSVRALGHSLDRHVSILDRRLDDVEASIPAAVADALAERSTQRHHPIEGTTP